MGYQSVQSTEPDFFEALVDDLSGIWDLEGLPEWIPCTDSYLLRGLPTTAERVKWLRKAKAEIVRRRIQERVDEIAEAYESEDAVMVDVLVGAFPKDLELHKSLSTAQRQMWNDKAALAAWGRSGELSAREPLVYFIACGDDLIKIGHTTDLASRLCALRTGTPKALRVLCLIPGSRDLEQALHRKFASHRVGREWFSPCTAITEFISNCQAEDL